MTTLEGATAIRGIYFFLSYAHSSPLPDHSDSDRPNDPDHWVRVFYGDLHRRVRQVATPPPGWEIGFIDDELSPDTDWKARLAAALGATEVFVPLYSPGYLNRAWPLSERKAFDQRLRSARRDSASGHVQPLLWIPVQSDPDHPEVAEARLLGVEAPDYARHGLRALCMLRSYQDQYKSVVDRLAREIVRVAEQDRLGRSRAPAPSGVASAQTNETPIVLSVLAPEQDNTGTQRSSDWYGPTATAWRPFGPVQAQPLIDYVVNVVEQSGLPARVVEREEEFRLFEHYPGIVFVDPWILDTPGGRERLRGALDLLGAWVTIVIVTNQADPEYVPRGAELSHEVAGMLGAAGIDQEDGSRRVTFAHDVEEFVPMTRMLVVRTRRAYLRYGDTFPPKGPSIEPPWSLHDTSGS
jgi:FxsC-like protein